MSASVNQQISGLTVREGGKLLVGYYTNTINNIYTNWYIVILNENNCITNSFVKELLTLLTYSTKAAFNGFGKDEEFCLLNTQINILN